MSDLWACHQCKRGNYGYQFVCMGCGTKRSDAIICPRCNGWAMHPEELGRCDLCGRAGFVLAGPVLADNEWIANAE